MATNPLLEDLQQTAKEYVEKERTRLQNEAEVLQAILDGRTGGRSLQTATTAVVAAVAQASLVAYLARK